MESRNWRLCEQHKYYVQRNISLLPVAQYRETVSVERFEVITPVSNDNYSSVSNDYYSRSIPNIRMNLEEWSVGLYLVPKRIAWSVIG